MCLFKFIWWYKYNCVKYLWNSYLPELIHLINSSDMLRYANQQKDEKYTIYSFSQTGRSLKLAALYIKAKQSK